MTLEDLRSTLAVPAPPATTPLVQALWWAAKGDWERAHVIAQDVDSRDGAWVHAYLHRVEGDQWNADYWYKRAGKPSCKRTLDEEWAEITRALLLK